MNFKSPCCPDGVVEYVSYRSEYDQTTEKFIPSEGDAVFYVCTACGDDSLEWEVVELFNNTAPLEVQ